MAEDLVFIQSKFCLDSGKKDNNGLDVYPMSTDSNAVMANLD